MQQSLFRSRFVYITLFVLLLTASAIPQNNVYSSYSKHKTDLQQHDQSAYPEYPQQNQQIIELEYNTKSSPASTVFGYFPYWKYPQAMDYLQYDLLSHIALFDFGLSIDGSLCNPPNWPWTDLINEAHENGVKIVPCIVNFTGSEIHAILNNQEVQQTLFSNLLNLIQQYALDGVNMDFEGVYQADRGEILNAFMSSLTSFLHNANPNYEVSFAAPPVNWGGWDFEGLATSCDYLFIMGYNFWGGWSTTSGPCAPLIGGAYNLTNTVTVQYGSVTAVNPEKLILGVPYYGNKWITDGPSSYAGVVDHLSQPTYEIAMDHAEEDGLLWDEWSETSWSLYWSDDYYQQTWFDTDSSTGLKYDLAEQYNLKGVGIWALGYDGDRTELWDELRKRYGQNVGIQKPNAPLPIHFSPNPFKNRTKIMVHLNSASRLIIRVQDIQGYLIPEMSSSTYLMAGKHTIELNLSAYPAGMYFVRMTQENDETSKISMGKAFLIK